MKTKERLKGSPKEFQSKSLSCMGEDRPRKSVAVISITDLHVMAISLTISLDCLPQI